MLRELHPEIDVRMIYQRDDHHLLVKYGLPTPEQHVRGASPRLVESAGEALGLLAGRPVPIGEATPSEQTGAA